MRNKCFGFVSKFYQHHSHRQRGCPGENGEFWTLGVCVPGGVSYHPEESVDEQPMGPGMLLTAVNLGLGKRAVLLLLRLTENE